MVRDERECVVVSLHPPSVGIGFILACVLSGIPFVAIFVVDTWRARRRTERRCIDCKRSHGVDPCPECWELVCEKCFDPTEGMCLACPARARKRPVFDHEGHEIKLVEVRS